MQEPQQRMTGVPTIHTSTWLQTGTEQGTFLMREPIGKEIEAVR